jgi:ferrous iron transport protein A
VLKKSADNDPMLQLSVNTVSNAGLNHPAAPKTLAQLRKGESGTLDRLDLPEDVARRLMELGFLPGHVVVPARSAPGGEPRVYRVDGSEVALRRETASRLILRASDPAHITDAPPNGNGTNPTGTNPNGNKQ